MSFYTITSKPQTTNGVNEPTREAELEADSISHNLSSNQDHYDGQDLMSPRGHQMQQDVQTYEDSKIGFLKDRKNSKLYQSQVTVNSNQRHSINLAQDHSYLSSSKRSNSLTLD